MVRPTKVGVVVSQGKMDKTVKVRIRNTNWNRHVSKYIVSHRNMLVHDELNKCREGDVVRIQYVRPLSARKSWAVADFMKLQGTSWEKYQQEIPGEVKRDEVQKLQDFAELRKVREATKGEAPEVLESRASGNKNVEVKLDDGQADLDRVSELIGELSFMSAEAKRILSDEPQKAEDILRKLGKEPHTLNASTKRNLIRKYLRSEARPEASA